MPFMEVECSREVTGISFCGGRREDSGHEERKSKLSEEHINAQGRPVAEWHSCDFTR